MVQTLKLNKKKSKVWKLLFLPKCFGDAYYAPCTARYLTDFCIVADECNRECRRRKRIKYA